MDYTFSTVIIPAAYQDEAQADMGSGFFTVALSSDGKLPITNYMSSGPFDNAEMDAIVNVYDWPNKVYFGQDWQSAIAAEGLQVVTPEEPAAPLNEPEA